MRTSRRRTAFFVTVSMFAWPAVAGEVFPIPDLTGVWGRNSFDFEPLSFGPRPVTNVRRFPNGAIDQRISVGDHNNPILRPEAADSVRRRGAVSLSGTTFPDPSNQCAPYPPPFSMSITLQLMILQRENEVLILSLQDQGVRHVRLNGLHPARVTPSWYGDSIGHFEGDTLVVDTIGFKVGPLSMLDRYGTPHSGSLHLTERFRLVDSIVAKDATAQHEKEYGRIGGPPGAVRTAPNYEKGLQVIFTVEDPEMFTSPWSAAVTYQPTTTEWSEYVCAENVREYFSGKDAPVPVSSKPDF